MDPLAEGRTAEVFAFGSGRVVKLDRPEFNGLAPFEAEVLTRARAAGPPVPEVFETVTVLGRHGIVLERLEGPALSDVIRSDGDIGGLAEAFVELHCQLHVPTADGIPDLVGRLRGEIAQCGLPDATLSALLGPLDGIGGDEAGLCHFDFHPANIIVTSAGWKVIDWLTAAAGPPAADFARTLLLLSHSRDPHTAEFVRRVSQLGQRRRSLEDEQLQAWMRTLAAARLAEGFTGPYASWLRRTALGAG